MWPTRLRLAKTDGGEPGRHQAGHSRRAPPDGKPRRVRHHPLRAEALKITKEIIEAHLNCTFKGHLKLAGQRGTRSDYEAMATAVRAVSRDQAIVQLTARFGEEAARRGTTIINSATLKKGVSLLP